MPALAKFELFDDRPSSCERLTDQISDRGIEVIPEKTPSRFAKKLKALEKSNESEPGSEVICGYGVDNHIEHMTSLKHFGLPEVTFEEGMAGWNVVSNVLIPGILAGRFPRAPIAMISGQPLVVPQAQYRSQFEAKFSAVHFFKKSEFANDNSNVLEFLNDIEECKRKIVLKEPSTRENREALKSMLEISTRRLALSNDDLTKLFRLAAPLEDDDLFSILVASTTLDWEDKVDLIFRLTNALSRMFNEQQAGEPRDKAVADFIRIADWPALNASIYDLLIDGRPASIDLALDVVLSPGDY